MRPAVGADEPLNRRARAVSREPVAVGSTLAVAHLIGRALAVELRAALAEAEQRTLRQQERHPRRRRVERQSLERLRRLRVSM